MGRVAEPGVDSRLGGSSKAGSGGRLLAASGTRRVSALIISAAMAASIGLAVSCGGSSDKSCSSGDPGCPLPDRVSRFVELRDEADSADCICRSLRGWVGDVDECMTAILPSTDDLSSCLGGVALEHVGGEANLECAIEAEKGLAACLSASSCSEADYNACFDETHQSFADCAEITALVFRELNACF